MRHLASFFAPYFKDNGSPSKTFVLLGGTALFAALGQYYLTLQDDPLTLYWGAGFYLFAIFFFLRLTQIPAGDAPGGPPLSRRLEAFLFLLILLVAAFFRFYKLDEFPAGLFPDESCEAWGGLRILHEGWRPFYEIYHLYVWDPPLYYLLPIWFKFFNPTQFSLYAFSVCLSLCSFPLIYWAFRQLSTPRLALAALYILAVMRWDFMFNRNAHPVIQVHLYMFGALAFWLHALRTGKRWAFWLGAAFFSVGFYVYEAYKAFPILILFLLAYEWLVNPSEIKANARRILETAILSFILILPWLWMVVNRRSIGGREDDLFIFPEILKGGSLKPLIHHLGRAALMLNRSGDDWFIQNLPKERMLDDVTGVLFVLGFFYASFRIKERRYFYAVSGVLFMSLTGILTVNPVHCARVFGTVPFIAFLAASALLSLEHHFGKILVASGRKSMPIFLLTALGTMGAQNFWTYFRIQARNDTCWRGPATDVTAVAKKIAQYGDDYDYYLSPRFYGHFTVLFLGYSHQSHMHELRIAKDLNFPPTPAPRGAIFALEEGQTGVLELLRSRYPGGTTDFFKDLQGHNIVYFYRIPVSALEGMPKRKAKQQFRPETPVLRQGLKGVYRLSADWTTNPFLTQYDPVVNFTFRNDFPVRQFPPLSVHWSGDLHVPASGFYRFMTLSTDKSSVLVDQKPVLSASNSESADIFLTKGVHLIGVYFQKTSGVDAVFNLLWRPPAGKNYEIIPNRVLGGLLQGGIAKKPESSQ